MSNKLDVSREQNRKTTSVVLADDHESVRQGIRSLLEKAPDIVIVGEAIDGTGALRSVIELDPDVLLLDIEMPGINGIEVARKLATTRNSDVKILVISAYDDHEYIREVLANGASGYIIKSEAPRCIIEAIRGVARGEKEWVSPHVSQQVQALKKARQAETTLTYREIEILRLAAKGNSLQDISAQLQIDPAVLKKQVKALTRKLGAATSEEAVVNAASQGWI
ncbi:MAG TPA: response regulator transcription factor [Levilinea sp.]|nr:response regulator transcription factor [Levilinea sp.]